MVQDARPLKELTDVELTLALRELFEEKGLKHIVEELVVRGWSVQLNLPTYGTTGFEYRPIALAAGAGFQVTRVTTPHDIASLKEKS